VLIRDSAPQAASSFANMERSSSGKISYPANRCLVATGLNLRSHVNLADARHFIKQTFFDLGLTREADRDQCTPVEVFKLLSPSMMPPIRWKMVFKSAEAAELVLERHSLAGHTGFSLRAFENRHEREQAARAGLEPVWTAAEPQQPVRQSSAATEVLARAPSTDSVVIVEPLVKHEVKINQQPTSSRVQFTTRHALQPVQPQPQTPAAITPPATMAAAPEPQHTPSATAAAAQSALPVQQTMVQIASPAAPGAGAYPPGWIPFQPPPRPMMPMVHAYHGAPPPHGMYMQHPGGPYPYGAPMGYVPAGFVPAPMTYPSYPPQF
jgi:hypothetical protein